MKDNVSIACGIYVLGVIMGALIHSLWKQMQERRTNRSRRYRTITSVPPAAPYHNTNPVMTDEDWKRMEEYYEHSDAKSDRHDPA